MEILETRIIPSLLKSSAESNAFIATDGSRRHIPTAEEVAHFAEICMGADADLPGMFVQGLISEGLHSETIFLHLLTPAARHLGALWDEDICDFTQVTIGLLRMQQITFRLGDEFQQMRKTAMSGRRALFSAVPGSQHTLGVMMVSEFFRRDGWQVWMELGVSESQLLTAVRMDWFDVIRLSVGTEAHAKDLVDIISQLRQASANAQAIVVIGGPLLISEPNLHLEVGADGGSGDAKGAIALVEQLLAQLTVPASRNESASPLHAELAQTGRVAGEALPGTALSLKSKELMSQMRHLRIRRGVTLKEAAAQLGISQSALVKYEHLERKPPPAVLQKIQAWINQMENQKNRVIKFR